MSEIKTLRLKNSQVLKLAGYLNSAMSGENNRARNRFIRLLQPRLEEIERERLAMLERCADKDEKGKPIVENGTFKIGPDGLKTFQEEYNNLADEEFILDILPSIEADLAFVRTFVLHIDKAFNTSEGLAYEEICEALEAV